MARTLPDRLKWSPERTRRNTRLLAVAAAVVIGLLVSLFVVDRLRLANREQNDGITNDRLQLARAAELLSDMQGAQRGFLITGESSFLDPYRQARSELPAVYAMLRNQATLVGRDAPQLVEQFIRAANDWQAAAEATVQAPATATTDPAVAITGQQLFDTVLANENSLEQYLDGRTASLQRTFRQLYTTSFILLLLVSLAMIGTIIYGVSLVQRMGLITGLLQVRQDRVQGYNRVVTTLNGLTELQPLVNGVLPVMLEMVGAQAGVIYLQEEETLQPVAALGVNGEALPAVSPGEGLPGAAVQQNRAIVVSELPEDTPFRIHAGIGVAAPRSIVSLPLRFGSEVLGALSIASLTIISDDDVQQLRLAASQLATAISNARAFEDLARQRAELQTSNAEIARRLEESETLQEMGRELATQRDAQRILQLVCREVRHLLHADFASVATQINNQGAMRIVAVEGARSDIVTTHLFPRHKGLPGRVIDQGGPVVIDDLNDDERRAEFVVQAAEGIQAALGVPLFRKTEPIGALMVGFRHPQTIGDEMIGLTVSLAAYASVAIENARLLHELGAERDLVKARARELEEKNREVERANRLKSEFVANMSHELRTPLNSILALSQIMADELDGPLNEEQHKQVAIIERNGHNLLRLINDILNLSKIEAGKLDLVLSSFRPYDVLEAVQTTVLPLVVEKRLDLVVEAASGLPALQTDENKLKQILLNLLSNAVKFTERGTVTLRARAGREVGGLQDAVVSSEWITFEVQDTGVGIAAEDLPTIWEEFQQIDGSLSRRYEGTGLGLAIVRRLVGLLGGDITAQSVLGKGSTFTFSIPVRLPEGAQVIPIEDGQRRAPVDQTVVAPQKTPAEKPLVLVVDDEPEVLYILEKYLRDDGYEIVVAQSGDEAIAKAREFQPFAMTLDVMLPGRDGWEVIQTLKADPRTAEIPIIMLSMLDNRQLGYSLGASDYLVKPVSRNDLLQRLAQLRNGHPIETALVVDDDPIEQRVLATTLRGLDIAVTTHANGPDALRWLESHVPDLITLDLMMPGMDGFDVLEEIKHRPSLRDVPVLIITAKEITTEDRLRLNSRIEVIINKGPRQRDEVLDEIRGLLNRQRLKQARKVDAANE